MTREKHKDPFEKMAEDLVEAGHKIVKKNRKKRPECPECGKKMWKKKNGNFSCANTDCSRDMVPVEEIASKKIMKKFLGNL